MKKVDYLETKPIGTCPICGINLWAEHDNGPAPNTLPCQIEGCLNNNKAALVIPFDQSLTGSAMADLG